MILKSLLLRQALATRRPSTAALVSDQRSRPDGRTGIPAIAAEGSSPAKGREVYTNSFSMESVRARRDSTPDRLRRTCGSAPQVTQRHLRQRVSTRSSPREFPGIAPGDLVWWQEWWQ